MITKPEDAVPHEAFVEITPENGHPHTEWERFFTSSECAEIARAYAKASVGQKDSCDAKFREWGFVP